MVMGSLAASSGADPGPSLGGTLFLAAVVVAGTVLTHRVWTPGPLDEGLERRVRYIPRALLVSAPAGCDAAALSSQLPASAYRAPHWLVPPADSGFRVVVDIRQLRDDWIRPCRFSIHHEETSVARSTENAMIL
jgi:hypothetical protein